jgi:hypothetical protein
MAREFDLDAFMDRAPSVRGGERGAELLQLRLRRADDVAAAGPAKPRQIVGAGHAAIADPHTAQHAMAGLHSGHDRLQGPRVVGVAGEHLVAQGKAVEGHDQRDAHLLAIRPMIPRVAAPRQRICFGLALEICARDIIEQHFVLNRKQLAAAPRQMRFERLLVQNKMIEGAVKPVLVDLIVLKLQQIGKRRAAIPILGNVQFARRLTQPRRHQNGRHLRP